MTGRKTKAANLLQHQDWIAVVCNSDDAPAIQEVLFGCGEIMLPYWNARFQNDEAMERLVAAMRDLAEVPGDAGREKLSRLIPRHRLPRHWNLSPVWEFPDPVGSDCPADFAGDAITYAALAMNVPTGSIDRTYLRQALDTAVEMFGRLFAERDSNEDSQTNHFSAAIEYLRIQLLSRIG